MKIGPREFQRDNLTGTQWVGVVEDNADPLFEGRCKIKVHGKLDEIPTDKLPWARPGNSLTSGSDTGGGMISPPKVGAVVQVTFDNGDIYSPTYHYNIYPSDDLKAEIEGSYDNAHSLIYDTTTEGGIKIYFTEEKGLMMDYKETQINILPDNSIIIQNPNGDKVELLNDGNITVETSTNVTVKSPEVIIDAAQKIELGKGATEDVVLGNSFMALFNSHVHIGNLGAPTTPSVTPMTPTQLSTGGGPPIVKTK
jgi:uncharacterized protein involved in type VI secretion and phage assembly